MTTAAGAGTYAATLTADNGVARNLAGYTSPKKQAITKVQIMGANATYIDIARSAHQGENLTLMPVADTLADAVKSIDIADIMGGKGIIVDLNEVLTINVTVSGNATVLVFIELDDKIATVNAKAVRAAGANAAVAATPTDTGGNVPTGMNPNKTYRPRAVYATSTTIQNLTLSLNDSDCISLDGQTAIVSGQGYQKLRDEQAAVMQGTGNVYAQTFKAFITASAADAANVQFIGVIFECN